MQEQETTQKDPGTQTPPQPAKPNYPENLGPQDALGILVQAVRFGQSKGIYSLEDAALISKAVAVFVRKEDEPKQEGPDQQN